MINGHLGFIQIKLFAQSCRLGDQAECVLGPDMSSSQLSSSYDRKCLDLLMNRCYCQVDCLIVLIERRVYTDFVSFTKWIFQEFHHIWFLTTSTF